MKTGLAAWHYKHRSTLENVEFFADNGFKYVSLHGLQMLEVAEDPWKSRKLAELIRSRNLTITVHHALAFTHSDEDVAKFKKEIDTIAAWQNKYHLLEILSFDVHQAIRDHMAEYLDYAIMKTEGCKIAIEDFGLIESERVQIEHLKGNPRFGYLLDIGHMFIRLVGKNTSGANLFTNSADECEATENPGYEEFLRAFRSKEFPIYEIHLSNNDGVRDLHTFLDEGSLNLAAVAKVLKEIGFDGIATIESAPGYTFECFGAEADEGILATRKYWEDLQ